MFIIKFNIFLHNNAIEKGGKNKRHVSPSSLNLRGTLTLHALVAADTATTRGVIAKLRATSSIRTSREVLSNHLSFLILFHNDLVFTV